MGTRSLFNPGGRGSFSSGGGGFSAGPADPLKPKLKLSKEMEDLLKYGAYDPSLDAAVKPFEASRPGLFGYGTRLADEANAEFFAKQIQAKYASDLAQRNALGLEQFRTNENIRQQGAFQDLARQEEERNLTEQGTALGQDIGNLPAEQINRIFPYDQTFNNPAEQERAFTAKFGAKMPIVEAPSIGLKGFGSGGYLNPLTREVIEPSEFKPRQEITVVPTKTGKMVPQYDEQTGKVTMTEEVKEYPKSVTSYERIPGQSYNINEPITQGEINNIKPPTVTQSGVYAKPPTSVNPLSTQGESGYFSTDVGPGHPQRPPAAGTGVAPSSPIQAKPTDNVKVGPANIYNYLNSNAITGLKDITSGLFGGLKTAGQEIARKLQPIQGQAQEQQQQQIQQRKPTIQYFADAIAEGSRFDEQQKDMFNNLIRLYIKNNSREPTLEETRALANVVINSSKKDEPVNSNIIQSKYNAPIIDKSTSQQQQQQQAVSPEVKFSDYELSNMHHIAYINDVEKEPLFSKFKTTINAYIKNHGKKPDDEDMIMMAKEIRSKAVRENLKGIKAKP